MYVYMSYIVHIMHPSLILSLCYLDYLIKQDIFKHPPTIKFRYFFPLLHIVACNQQTQKTPKRRGKTKNFNASEFLTIDNC